MCGLHPKLTLAERQTQARLALMSKQNGSGQFVSDLRNLK